MTIADGSDVLASDILGIQSLVITSEQSLINSGTIVNGNSISLTTVGGGTIPLTGTITGAVASVAGKTGTVILSSTDISDFNAATSAASPWAATAVIATGLGLTNTAGTLSAAVGSVAGLTGNVTAAQIFAAIIAGLPTTLPSTPGQPWLNGGVLQVS